MRARAPARSAWEPSVDVESMLLDGLSRAPAGNGIDAWWVRSRALALLGASLLKRDECLRLLALGTQRGAEVLPRVGDIGMIWPQHLDARG